MPEEISEMPVTATILKSMDTDSILQDPLHVDAGFDASRRPREVSWMELTGKVDGYIGELKAKYQDLPENHVEMVADLMFGPLRFNTEELGHGDIDRYSKEAKARVAHNLTHSIFYASTGEVDPVVTERVYDIVSLYENIANSEVGRSSGVRDYWIGIKSQVGIMRALQAGGYNVLLPDYTQDPLETDDKDNEVLQLDVISGIDLIAKKGDTTFLVNSKGKLQDETGDRLHIAKVHQQRIDNLPPLLAEYQTSLESGKVKKVEITLPTNDYSLSGLSKINKNKKKALQMFAVSSEGEEVVKYLDKIIAVPAQRPLVGAYRR